MSPPGHAEQPLRPFVRGRRLLRRIDDDRWLFAHVLPYIVMTRDQHRGYLHSDEVDEIGDSCFLALLHSIQR